MKSALLLQPLRTARELDMSRLIQREKHTKASLREKRWLKPSAELAEVREQRSSNSKYQKQSASQTSTRSRLIAACHPAAIGRCMRSSGSSVLN